MYLECCRSCGGALNTGYICTECGQSQQPEEDTSSIARYYPFRFVPRVPDSIRKITIRFIGGGMRWNIKKKIS